MEVSAAEQTILDRYHHKTRMAGGPRNGFVLRRGAIPHNGKPAAEELDSALDGLVQKGLLAASEDQRFYFLTEAGAELLGGR